MLNTLGWLLNNTDRHFCLLLAHYFANNALTAVKVHKSVLAHNHAPSSQLTEKLLVCLVSTEIVSQFR